MTERDARLVAAAKTVQTKLTALAAAMHDADRRDHRLLITLREKYGIPQAMTEMANAYSGLMATLADYLKEEPL